MKITLINNKLQINHYWSNPFLLEHSPIHPRRTSIVIIRFCKCEHLICLFGTGGGGGDHSGDYSGGHIVATFLKNPISKGVKCERLNEH
jgi:hypothetical protein